MINLRTKAVIVTGVQWAYENVEAIKAFVGDRYVKLQDDGKLAVHCNDDSEYADLLNPGDWIVKLDDTFEIIPADEFDKWFERV